MLLVLCLLALSGKAVADDLDVTMEVIGEDATEERIVRELILPRDLPDAASERGERGERGTRIADDARERGRAFGQERADEARQRGQDARQRGQEAREGARGPATDQDRPSGPPSGPPGRD
ncbi:hypothetical protein [Natronocella acetinitrilica]|nr:hypothetical protein [Natronocella acetinitrilica]